MSGLPNGWVMARLGNVSEVRLGRQRSPSRATGDRMRPYLRAANATWKGLDLTDVKEMDFTELESVSYELRTGDLLLSEASGSPGEVGKPVQYRGEIEGCCFQNTLLRVRLPGGMLPDLYEYFFRGEALSGKFADGSRGVGIHHLGAAAFANWAVPIIPVPEQQRILLGLEEAFSKLDAGERGLHKVRQQLNRLRDSILFAAVTGRLAISAEGVAFGDEELARRHRNGWENWIGRRRGYSQKVADSSKPPAIELPDHWRWVRWSAVGLSQNGRVFPSSEYGTEGIRLLRPGNLSQDGSVQWSNKSTRFLPNKYLEKEPDLIVGEGELVMNLTAQSLRDNFLGRVCLTGTAERCLLNQRLARLTPTGVDPGYVHLFFRSPIFRRFVTSLNSGSLIQHMYTSQLDDCWISLPPQSEQAMIAEAAARHLSIIADIETTVGAQILRSAALRRSILKSAFEGKLVPQDPTDEPASVLLERIAADRLTAVAKAPRKTRAKVSK